MEISFKDKKLKKTCEDHVSLKVRYGNIQAESITQRINELLAAENLFDISKLPHARLHLLKGSFKNHYAVDIKHPFRIVMTNLNGDTKDLKSISKIIITDIIDYH